MKTLLSTIVMTLLLAPAFVDAQFNLLENFFSTGALAPRSVATFPVDVLWETDTFIPTNYRGKALPVPGSIVRMVALTPTQNSDSLLFEWEITDSTSPSAAPELAGQGKNVFSFVTNAVQNTFTHSVSVFVSNSRTGETVRKELPIPVVRPELYLYPTGDGRATGRTVVQDSARPDSVYNIQAVPFYFTVSDISSLLFSWRVGGTRVATPESDNLFTLRVGPTSFEQQESIEVVSMNPKGRGIIDESASARLQLYIRP